MRNVRLIMIQTLHELLSSLLANASPVAMILAATKQTRRSEDRTIMSRMMIGLGIQLATALIAVIAGSYLTLKLVEQDVMNIKAALIEQAQIREREIQRLDNKDVRQDEFIFKQLGNK